MTDFAATIKRIRTERGMSQEEFATFLDTSKQNISRYENGEVSPKITTAAKIAKRLGISLSQLNGENDHDSEVTPAQNLGREQIAQLFTDLSVESQEKLLDYAKLLLTAERASLGRQE